MSFATLTVTTDMQQRQPDERLLSMTPDELESYCREVWIVTQELLVARANRLNVEGRVIAERAGKSPSWVTKLNNLGASKFESLALYAVALGLDLSAFVAEAEDLVELRRKRRPLHAVPDEAQDSSEPEEE